ncbi:MAG: alpha/beta hydrolase [Bacteroidota bacterium]
MSDEEAAQALEGNDVQPKFGTITTGGRTMHYAYTDREKESLVVFVHGSPGSWSAFLDFFQNDSLLDQYDLLAIDRPGFGQSDAGWPAPHLEQQSCLLQAVIEQFDHEKILLVGHSLGGPVIARMAMDFPEAYHGLVFVAPSIDPQMEKYEWYRSWIKTKVGGWVTPQDFWVSNEEIMPLKGELTKMLPLWERIKVCSIVIQGKKDMLVPWENAEFARRQLPADKVDIRYLQGVNHFIPWTHPESIIRAIFDLL